MEEITGEYLREFAINHDLYIMPHRDADEWAKKINENNGMCPCGKECPCGDCTCKFYMQAPHADVKNDEMRKAVRVLEKTHTKLMNLDIGNIENARGEINKLREEIVKEAAEHECSICDAHLQGLARKLNFLAEECALDDDSCRSEHMSAITRTEELIETFTGADRILQEQEKQEKSQRTKPGMTENEETLLDVHGFDEGETEEPKERHPYRECMSVTMKETLDGYPTPIKFKAATLMCGRNNRMSKEEALAACGVKEGENDEEGHDDDTIENNTGSE